MSLSLRRRCAGSQLARSTRSGFTLVELLIVVTIIGILMAMLFPAAQAAREAARKAVCKNNMRQVALATLNFHEAQSTLPYATIDRLPTDDPDQPLTWHTGLAQIMPYLEGDLIASRWNPRLRRDSQDDSDGDGYTNAMLTQMVIPTYYCPSMSPPSAPLTDNRGPSSYLFSAGTPDAQMLHYWEYYDLDEQPKFDGAVVPVITEIDEENPSPNVKLTRIADITDGTSYTFLLGETDFTPRGVPSTSYGGVWAFGYIGYTWGTTYHPFNNHANTSTVYGAFRSQHPNGASFAMVDGSVRFVADSIDRLTYIAQSTRAGREIISEGEVLQPIVATP